MQRVDLLGAARTTSCLLVILSIAACSGSGEDGTSVLSLDIGELVETTVTGSVGDGPITNGRVVIENSSGQVLATQRSDEQANYRIQLNAGPNEFPLLVSVADGIDLVTGDAPSFELVSAILQPGGEQIVNLNPFGTLTVKIAQRMAGGLSNSNVSLAESAVKRHLGFGIDARTMGNPMFIVMDEQNAASVVRSSEAVGEAVRRSFAALLSTGQFGSEDDVIDAISADLTDGVLDGRGSEGADARLAATMSIVSAQVMLEVLVNRLEVGGTVATQSLDSAIQQVTEGNLSVPLTSTLAVTEPMISQARIVLDAATRLDANPELADIRDAAATLQPGMSSGQVSSMLPSNAADVLDATVQQISLATDAKLQLVNDAVAAGNPPDNDPVNSLPTISGFPLTDIMSGVAYEFLPMAGDADGDQLTFAVSGLPAWAAFDTTNGRLSGTPDDGHVGTSGPIQISVADGFGTTALPVFRITVVRQPNQLPEIGGSAPTAVTAGNLYDFVPTASDPDDDALTFTITNLPGWAIFDPATGRVSGTPGMAHVGVYTGIQIGVSDGEDRATLAPFSIRVSDIPNQPPIISGVPNGQVLVGNNYIFTPSASDGDGDPLAFSATGVPAWLNFDSATGRLSGVPTAADEGDHTDIRIIVSDGLDSAVLPTFAISVLPIPNAAPTITGSPSTSVRVDAPYSFAPTAVDADGDPLTFSIAGRPGWASFDVGTGRLDGTPTSGDEGVYADIRISVTDGRDSASLPTFAIVVKPPSNLPPQIGGSPPASVTAGESYDFTPASSDPDGDPLSYSIQNRPDWATFDVSNGRLQGVPSVADVGVYPNIRISVTDGRDTVSLPALQVSVSDLPNQPPIIGGQPSSQAASGQAYSFTPTASDPDGDPLSFTISGQPGWADFDAATGRISGTPGSGDAGVYADIRISVSDGTDTASLAGFSIVVEGPPNQAPSIAGAPSTQTTVDVQYSFTPTASDPDGDALSFAISGRPSWASFDSLTGRLVGTPAGGTEGAYDGILITVSDGEATSSLPAFSIVVAPRPNSAPSIGGSPANEVTVGSAYSFRPSASDPDGDVLNFSIAGMPAWASFDTGTGQLSGAPSDGEEGVYAGIGITVSDGQDSASLPVFAITVRAAPNQPPSISGAPSPQVDVNAAYSFTPVADDPDGDPLTFSIAGMPAWASFNAATGKLSGIPAAGEDGVYANIGISVSDGKDSASLPAFSITVDKLPNRPPTIAGIPAGEVVIGSAYAFTPTADDPDGDNLVFTVSGLPAWASFDTTSGRLWGTPVAGEEATYIGIRISVSDGTATASLADFSIAVVAQSLGSALLRWTSPTENADGSILTDLAGYKVYYGTTVDSTNSVVTISNPAVSSYLVENLPPGDWFFKVTAFDIAGNESEDSNIASKVVIP